MKKSKEPIIRGRWKLFAGVVFTVLCCALVSMPLGMLAKEADITDPDDLGEFIHYNGIIFDTFESYSADVEGALAVGGVSKIGTSGQFDFGAAASGDYWWQAMGKYENEKNRPTLLLNEVPASIGASWGSSVQAFGGPVVLNEKLRTMYDGMSPKVVGITKYAESDIVDKFFQDAETQTKELVSIINNANTKPDSFISNSNFCGWAAAWHKVNDKTIYTPNNLENINTSGINIDEILIVNIKDSGTVTVNEPKALESFADDYELIIFNFPNATTVKLEGGTITTEKGQLPSSAPAAQMPDDNARVAKFAECVIWNMPNAQEVQVNWCGSVGSVLAPYAKVAGNGGSINGMLISKSFTTITGMELHGFKMKNIFRVFENNEYYGEVELTKSEKGNTSRTLPGAVFRLDVLENEEWHMAELEDISSDQLQNTSPYEGLYITGNEGKIYIENLPEGKYRFVEVLAPEGYEFDSGAGIETDEHSGLPYYEFEIKHGSDSKLVKVGVENKKILTTNVELQKVDGGNDNPLDGAVFKLYQYIVDENSGDEYYESLDMNIQQDNSRVKLTELTEGTYHLVEQQAPDGYILLHYPVIIEIEKNSAGNDLVVSASIGETVLGEDRGIYKIPNVKIVVPPGQGMPIVTSVEIKKVDGDTEEGLSGAVFQLYKQTEGNEEYEVAGAPQITDGDGIAIFSYLDAGKYKIEEIESPHGYMKNEEPIFFAVEEKDGEYQVIYDKFSGESQIVIENQKVFGSIEVVKANVYKSGEEKVQLEGTVFELYRYIGFRGTEFVARKTTGADGTLEFTDLEPGTYAVEEVVPPAEYDLQRPYIQMFYIDENGVAFTYDDSGSSKQADGMTIEFNNSLAGGFTLVKHDGDTYDAPDISPDTLENVKFELFRQDEGQEWKPYPSTEKNKYKTDASGKIEAEKTLPYGKYKLVEVENPNEGYEGDQELEIEFVVNEVSTHHNLIAKNYKKEEEPEIDLTLKKVDEETFEELNNAVFMLEKKGPDVNGEETWDIISANIRTGMDGKGKVVVRGLTAGDYRFTEIKPPNGYAVGEKENMFWVKFSLEKSGDTLLVKKVEGNIDDIQAEKDGDMITLGNTKQPQFPYFSVYKVNADNKETHLVGAEFELYLLADEDDEEGQLYSSVKTDYDGKLMFPQLKKGHYRLIETVPAEGYVLRDVNFFFEVAAAADDELVIKYGDKIYKDGTEGILYIHNDVENEEAFANLTITKRNFAEPTERLKDAEFTLYRFDKSEEEYLVYSKIYSDENGELVFPQMLEGDYKLKETKAPEGYVESEKEFEFRVIENDDGKLAAFYHGQEITADSEIELSIYDAEESGIQPVDFYLTKIDGDTGETLQGAKFQLSYKEKEDDTTYSWSDTVVSDEDGMIHLEQLRKGYYRLEEIEPPKGYELTNKAFEFEVVEENKKLVAYYNGSVIDEKQSGTLVVKNYKEEVVQDLDLVVMKRDSGSTSGLAGAEFHLYHSEYYDMRDKEIYSILISEKDGSLKLPNLTDGYYELAETQAPAGYTTSSKVFYFEVRKVSGELIGYYNGHKITGEDDFNYAIYNTPETEPDLAEIEFEKVDSQDMETKLSGASFKLSYKASKTDSFTFYDFVQSDEKGKIIIKDLLPGDYELLEVSPPPGYENNAQKYTFRVELNSTGDAYVVTEHSATEIENTQLPRKELDLRIKKLDSTDLSPIKNAVFGLYYSMDYEETIVDAKLQARITSNEKGELVLPQLSEGYYQLIELEAPEGYDKTDKVFQFEVQSEFGELIGYYNGRKITGDKDFEYAIYNTAKKDPDLAQIVFTKTDSKDSSVVIEGAEFTLYHKVQGETESVWYDSAVSDARGTIRFLNLRPGDYELVETKAPTGYELDDTRYNFQVQLNDAGDAYEVILSDNISNTITNKAEATVELDLRLRKLDYNDREMTLSGAIFGLYYSEEYTESLDDAKFYARIISDENGELILPQLTEGYYQLAELKAPAGYELSSRMYYFEVKAKRGKLIGYYNGHEITEEDEFNYVIYNTRPSDPTPAELTLEKVDARDENVKLAGAEFTLLYRKDKNEDYVEVDYVKSNQQGTIHLSYLHEGEYLLQETKAPAGYEMNESAYSFQVKLNEKGDAYETVWTYHTKTIPNKADPTVELDLRITKLDFHDKTVLEDAVFGLYYSDTYTESLENAKLYAELISDKNGELILPQLVEGYYQLAELEAPSGYELSKRVYYFEVKAQGNELIGYFNGREIKDGDELSYVIYNTKTSDPKPAELTLEKVDAQDENKKLAGARFVLQYRENGSGQYETIDYVTSDQQGVIHLTYLYAGEYLLKETQAPAGYENGDIEYYFKVKDQNGELKVENENSVKISNEKIADPTADVKVVKIDADDSTRLRGAVFELYQYDKQKSGYISTGKTITTNRNGEGVFSGLSQGKYEIIETTSPHGYVKEKAPVEFEIRQNQNGSLELWMENSSQKESEMTITVENHSEKSVEDSVKVYKADADTRNKEEKELLPFAEFKLYRKVTAEEPETEESEETETESAAETEKEPAADNLLDNLLDDEFRQTAETEPQPEQTTELESSKPDPETEAETQAAQTAEIIENDVGVSQAPEKEEEWVLYGNKTYITDNHGFFYLKNLEPGEYKLVEDKAPKGYEKEKKSEYLFEVKLDEEGGIVIEKDSYFIYNTRVEEEPQTETETETETEPQSPPESQSESESESETEKPKAPGSKNKNDLGTKKSVKGTTPKTGDENIVHLYLFSVILSFLLLSAVVCVYKKK